MGIDCDTFWGMDPKTMSQYLTGYNRMREKKAKEEAHMADINAWLTGAYVTNAIGACFSKRGRYPDQPSMARKEEEENPAKAFARFAAEFNRRKTAR